jgi:putative nucleotidyltransferase with HDIG domain
VKDKALEYFTQIKADISANRLILPSLPEVAIRMRELTRDTLCTLLHFEHEIGKDAAITARVLKVANSAALRRNNPASTLKQAIEVLGTELVCSLVTQLGILQTMQMSKDKTRLHDFVASSLRISELCYSIASQYPHLNPEQAALAGLLHDIGKLPLRDFLLAQEDLSKRQRIEFEILLHPLVGALLLEHWRMHEDLVQVVRSHEQILRDSPKALPDYTDVVISANLLHYGRVKGRYAKYADTDIPALRKCQQNLPKSHLDAQLSQRILLSNALISA